MPPKKIQMYGANFKPEDEADIERRNREKFRLQHQNQDPKIWSIKNRKVFRHKLKKYIVQSCFTDIIIMSENGLQIIDVIKTSHPSEIVSLDISEQTLDIVSFSNVIIPEKGEMSKHLIVYGLEDQSYLLGFDSKVTNEHNTSVKDIQFLTPSSQHLKWKEYWVCDPKLLVIKQFLNTVSITPQGDAIVLAGNEFLTLWTRDPNISTHSYTLYVYFAKTLQENVYAHSIESIPDLGQIIQSDFTSDSRTLVTLEQDNQSKKKKIRVWFNSRVESIDQRMPKQFLSNKVKMNDGDPIYNQTINELENLNHVVIDLNPRARFDPTSIYCLPFPSLLYSKKEVMPAAFCVLSEKCNQVQLWVESLIYQKDFPFKFYCAHTFVMKRGSSKDSKFDICLLSMDSQENSNTYRGSKIGTPSCLLDPLYQDYVSLEKQLQGQKIFQNTITPNLNGKTSQDFLMMLSNQELNIFLVQGLRNYPQMHIECSPIFKIQLKTQNLGRDIKIQSIIEAGTDSFLKGSHSIKDTIKMTCLTSSGQMVQMSSADLSDRDVLTDSLLKLDTIKGDYVYEQKFNEIGPVCYHPSLPIYVYSENKKSLSLYRYETGVTYSLKIQNSQHLSRNTSLLDSYSCKKEIIKYQWIPKSCILIVLFEDSTVDIIGSDSFMDVIRMQSSNQIHGEIADERAPSQPSTPFNERRFQDIWQQYCKEGAIKFKCIASDIFNDGEIYMTDEKRLISIEPQEYNLKCDQTGKIQEMKFMTVGFKKHEIVIYDVSLKNLDAYEVAAGVELLNSMKLDHQILEIMSIWQDSQISTFKSQRECLPFLEPEYQTKIVLRIANSTSKLQDLMMIEVKNQGGAKSKDDACKVSVLWQKELPYQDKRFSVLQSGEIQKLDYTLKAYFNEKVLGIFVRSVGRQDYSLFLYDHSSQFKYLGYLNLLEFIDFEPHDRTQLLKSGFAIDIQLPDNKSSLIVITCLNRVFILGWNGRAWARIKTLYNICSLDVKLVDKIDLQISNQGVISLSINDKWHIQTCEYLQLQGNDIANPQASSLQADDESDDEQDMQKSSYNQNKAKIQHPEPSLEDKKIETLSQINHRLSESCNLHNVEVLKDLFINGKKEFVMKVLIQVNSAITRNIKDQELLINSSPTQRNQQERKLQLLHLSNIVNYSLNQLLQEIDTHVKNQVVIQEISTEKDNKKPKVDQGGFDDFFGGDDDSDDGIDLMDFDTFGPTKQKKEVKKEEVKQEEQKKEGEKSTEEAFLEIYEDLLTNIVKASDLQDDQQLIDFILVFRSIFSKDFASDTMSSNLMRQIYLETEEPDRTIIDKLLQQTGKKVDDEEDVVKKLAAHEIYAQMYGEDTSQKYAPSAYQKQGTVDIGKLGPWDSRKTALALFTANQDVIIDELKDRFDLENNANWANVRKLCLSVWIKDSFKLRLVVEWITKVAYREIGEQIAKSTGTKATPTSKAEATSLWYLLLNKKSALINLYEKEKGSGGDKVAQMLSQDFTVARWKTAATKNAMVLRQKQRYLLSAAFFILADDIPAALQIVRRSMNDPQLAILTCRMLMLQQPNNSKLQDYLDEIYDEDLIQRGREFSDNYLISIGLWGKKQYVEAVNHLQTRSKSLNYQEGIEHLFEKQANFDVQALANAQSKKASQEDLLPLVTPFSGFELSDVIIKLQKAPRVIDALKGNNSSTGYGADDADIFADFGPSSTSQQQKKEVKEKVELDIDLTLLISQMLNGFLSKRDTFMSLFLIRENREHIDVSNTEQLSVLKSLMLQILLDQVLQARHDESYLFRHEGSISTQVGELVDFVFGSEEYLEKQGMPKDKLSHIKVVKTTIEQEVQYTLVEYLRGLQGCSIAQANSINPMFIHEIDLRMNSKQIKPIGEEGIVIPPRYNSFEETMNRLEQRTMDLYSFILSNTNQVSISNFGTANRIQSLQQHRRILVDIETLVECLILFNHSEDQNNQQPQSHKEIVEYYTEEQGGSDKKKEEEKQPPKAKAAPKPSFDMFDGFGDESSDGPDLMDFDFSAPKKIQVPVKQISLVDDEPKVEQPKSLSDQQVQINDILNAFNNTSSQLQSLHFQIKATLVLYLSLFILATQMNKFAMCKDILDRGNLDALLTEGESEISGIQSRLNEVSNQIADIRMSGHIPPNQSTKMINVLKDISAKIKQSFDGFHFQNIKTQIQKFKFFAEELIGDYEATLQNEQENENQEEDEDDIQINSVPNKSQKSSCFLDPWQISLQKSIDEAQMFMTDNFQGNKQENKLIIGLLFRLGYIRPESFIFIQKYLQFMAYCKIGLMLLESIDEKQGMNQYQINKLLQETASSHSRKLTLNSLYSKEYGNIQSSIFENEINSIQEAILRPQLVTQQLYDHFKRAIRQMEDECTIYFGENLTTLSQQFLSRVMDPIKCQPLQLFNLVMFPFFKTKQKMEDFFKVMQIENDPKFFTKHINYQYLSVIGSMGTAEQDEYEQLDKENPSKVNEYTLNCLIGQVMKDHSRSPLKKKEADDDNICDSASTQLIRELYWNGIELFKQRSEQISDFAFDNTHNSDNIALGLMTSGCREIPTVNTLLFRNRIENGLQLIDDENLSWDECLHRYDELENIMSGGLISSMIYPDKPEFIQSKDEPIISTIDSLFSYKTIIYHGKSLYTNKTKIIDQAIEPCLTWNGRDSQLYMNQLSKLDIDHDDYTYAIESHPHLPLYVTGNRRGIICSWKFNQTKDKSLSQFMPEVDPRIADARKACVKKIAFNNFGDRIMSLNFEGSFSMYQIDIQSRQMRKIPIFSLYDNVDMKISDFDMVNNDNVICAISQKQKIVKVYDTLLPYTHGRNSTVMEVRLKDNYSSGNMILFNKAKQVLYVFNGRQGSMVELDMRKNLQMVGQYQLSKSEEITAVCLNQANDTLVTGYKDGLVKIHSLESYYEKQSKNNKTFKLKECIDAFPLSHGKKGTVQRIKINPKNGGLFAGSQSGILKLLRPKV